MLNVSGSKTSTHAWSLEDIKMKNVSLKDFYNSGKMQWHQIVLPRSYIAATLGPTVGSVYTAVYEI